MDESHVEEQAAAIAENIARATSEPAPRREVKAIRALNGEIFAYGELLPWKGVYFQVTKVEKGGTITLDSVGLTKKCLKKLIAQRGG